MNEGSHTSNDDDTMLVRLNALWKKSFNIDTLKIELEEYQNNRLKNYDLTTLENELSQAINRSNDKHNEMIRVDETNESILRHLEELKKETEAVERTITDISLKLNELRVIDPHRTHMEKLLRLASEKINEASEEEKKWEKKLTKTRNQRNRAKSLAFSVAQSKALEIDKIREEYNRQCAEKKRKERLEQIQLNFSETELRRLEARNIELQKEYEAQLKEEEVLRRKINRMKDFEEQNSTIRTLIQ